MSYPVYASLWSTDGTEARSAMANVGDFSPSQGLDRMVAYFVAQVATVS